MEMFTFEGKTVEEALTNASLSLGIASTDLDYEVVSTGSRGFLGIGAKPAVIKVQHKKEELTIKNVKPEKVVKEKKAEKSPAPVREKRGEKPAAPAREKKAEKPAAPVKEKKAEKQTAPVNETVKAPAEEKVTAEAPKAPVDAALMQARAKEFLERLFAAMKVEAEIKTEMEDDMNMAVELSGPDMGILIGKRGQTLDSIQYLTSLYVNKESDSYIRVKIDTENYRERRKETLETLAKNIAYKVKRTRKSVYLEPMNPYERRIIHSVLQNDKFVCTKSEGEEPYRKVVVMLKRNNHYNKTEA